MGKNRYDVKRGHFKNIEDDQLKELMEEIFGDVEEEDETLIIDDYGTIDHLEVWTEGRTGLRVDMKMDTEADVERKMFTLDPDVYSRYLEKGPVADELLEAFEENGISLSDDTEMSKQGGRWVVSEEGDIYSIRENDDLEVYEELAQAHISRWNDFLERATGFTAKKRKKRAKKKAKGKK